MKLSAKEDAELMQVYNTWWHSYLNGDVETYDSYLADDYRFVGSTNNEEYLNRKDTTGFFKDTADQFAGKAELRNTIRNMEILDNGLVLITDLTDAWVASEPEWVYYSRFRFTSLLRKDKEGWRFIYQHFSEPDSKAQVGETLGLEQISKENQELRDAIKRRTVELAQKNRELEIDTALERTRSQSMLMQHSSELDKTSKGFHEQLHKLGIQSAFSYLWLLDEENEKQTFWATYSEEKNGSTLYSSREVSFHLDKTDPYMAECLTAWKEGEKTHISLIPQEEVEYYLNSWDKLFSGIEGLDKDYFPDGLRFIDAYMKYGTFGLVSNRNLNEEEYGILCRFAIEFERAYTRFLDLQKAEAQAKEAQIEAALERIRSRTMAMQRSDELKEVIQLVYKQFVQLNIHIEHTGFIMDYKVRDDMHIWLADKNEIPNEVTVPYFDCAHWNSFNEAKENGTDFFTNLLSFEEKNKFYQDLFKLVPGVPEETLKYYFSCPGLAISTVLLDNVGLYIENFSGIPYSDEENSILMRFGKVFQQTYTRFRDLKQAEAQAREAQIETALERVRARALAMQEPEELKEVSKTLRYEMGQLGIDELETCSIYINDEKTEKAECWYALKDLRDSEKTLVTDYFTLNLRDTWVGRQMLDFYNSEDHQVSILMTGKPRIEWIRYCEEKSVPFRGYYGDVIPDRTYHLYKFSHGAIGVATPGDISEENWGLLKRAASVFSLAYSRFKDLTQARSDLQLLKEEKLKAETALVRLKSTQSQLIHAEKMASLGELTAGIAHEIQNPLNFVNNFAEVSADLIEEMDEEIDKGDSEEVKTIAGDLKSNLEKITHHGKRASSIVKGMLEHSRSSTTEKELTDLNQLTDEYLRLAYHGLRAKDKTFNADFKINTDDMLPGIKVIPQDIGRVILNLINNAFYAVAEKARKESDGFQPTVEVSTKNETQTIEIRIWDNGNGIPESLIEKIFQPFFTTKPTGKGTGLGLSMSYDIITKGHNGTMNVKTEEGKFTEFIIALPKKTGK